MILVQQEKYTKRHFFNLFLFNVYKHYSDIRQILIMILVQQEKYTKMNFLFLLFNDYKHYVDIRHILIMILVL